jgi:two-component system cell cycle sensor histidine kinase/response regulator CckA
MSGGTRRPVVLVVEDNPTTRKVVCLALGRDGFDVKEASTAHEALALAVSAGPELILQDLLLPDMDGAELVTRLRALAGVEHVPIIAFSGFLSRLECGRATALGFTDFLAKPVEPSRLVQVVRTHLPGKSAAELSPWKECSVLLVDDDTIQLKVGSLMLRALGYEVATAVDGLDALDVLRQRNVDAVVADVLMPRMDGFRLCAEIRRDASHARIPVILTSSNYVEDADRAIAERMGANAFVMRDPDLNTAVAALSTAMAAPREMPPPPVELATAGYHDRVVRQLERQAAMNAVFANRSSMHASMLSVVAGMSETLTRHHGIERALPDILASLLDASGISRGALYLRSEHDGALALAASLGFHEPVTAALRAFCGHRDTFDRVIGSKTPRAMAKLDGDARVLDALWATGIECALLIPFVSGDECLGLLLLASQTRDLAEHDWMSFARMMGVQIGQALALSRAFRKLAASEKRCRTLLDSATECIVTLDLEGRITEVNPEGERFLARPAAELNGQPVFELIAPDGREQVRHDLAMLVDTGRGAIETTRFVRPGGAIVIADISATVVEIDGTHLIVSIWRDVTAKRAAEAELRLLHDVTLAASEAPDVHALFDVVLRTLGDAGHWTFGAAWRPRSQSSSLSCEHVWTRSVEDRQRLGPIAALTFAPNEGLLGRAWATRRSRWTHDLAREVDCPRSATASTLGLHAGLVVPVIAGGEVTAVIELFKDTEGEDEGFLKLLSTLATHLASIIERKRAEDALRASEARFARLWESGIVGIATADLAGTTYDANDEFLRMLGYTRDELAAGQLQWANQTPPEWRSADETAIAQLRTTGSARPWEKELIRKDGVRVPVLIGVAMLDAQRFIAFLSDLSEKKQVEASLHRSDEQLRQAQKMEAVGRLAGGIAHDFNNALSVVLSYGEMMLDELRPGEPMRDGVEEICKAGFRAAGLTRQLLMFSRQQVVAPRVLDLNEILLDIDKMLQRILGADIELLSLRSEPLGKVRADAGSIEQVILNLVVNARDAMPTGGKLTLETSNVMLDQDYANAHHGASPGPHVRLTVTDTGVGMDRLTQSRIFEPFFTTKERGKGTGLGLSTVFGIVQQSGGSIWVYSEPGMGTTFKIHLPRIDADKADISRSRPIPTISMRGTETILLVEDEDQVRAVARDILRRNGYKILEARNAGEAILLSETAGVISLLLTDVVMPQMSGPALAIRIAGHYPGIRILCMSGYTDDSIVRHGVLDATMAYLQKPFTPDTLTRKVREVLDAAPP